MPRRGWLRRWWLVPFALLLALPLLALLVVPPSTLMLGRWLTLQPVEREVMPFAAFGSALPRAVIAAEDDRFCQHGGVDWESLRSVMQEAGRHGSPSRGASTLSMQTAKNLFLWPGRSYLRKAIEIPLALWLDLLWPKRRMLEIYLNIAEWGDGLFGAEAASQHYFGKPAAKLTRHEAALLAAALPNPKERDPRHPSAYHQGYAATIAARSAMLGGEALACLR